MNKKISLLAVIVLMFVVGAVVYSLGYRMAMNKFNNVISYNQEKQKMYSTLSDVDYNVRNLCIENIDEDKLITGICKGYVSGVSENCKFFTDNEYEQFVNENKNAPIDISDKVINSKIGYIYCVADKFEFSNCSSYFIWVDSIYSLKHFSNESFEYTSNFFLNGKNSSIYMVFSFVIAVKANCDVLFMLFKILLSSHEKFFLNEIIGLNKNNWLNVVIVSFFISCL